VHRMKTRATVTLVYTIILDKIPDHSLIDIMSMYALYVFKKMLCTITHLVD
jgi:hypothetical protein